jgi:hypothetical protein
MKAVLVVVELCLFIAFSPTIDLEKSEALAPEPALPADLSGVYRVEPEGSLLAGSCLVYKVGEGYLFLWATVSRLDEKQLSAVTMRGTGLRKGNEVAVSWGAEEKVQGVTMYSVRPKQLVGEWVVGGALGRRTKEVLTKVSELKLGE